MERAIVALIVVVGVLVLFNLPGLDALQARGSPSSGTAPQGARFLGPRTGPESLNKAGVPFGAPPAGAGAFVP